MAVPDTEHGASRTVSVVASGAAAARVQHALESAAGLHLHAIAERFTELVAAADFPSDVVVLVEPAGDALTAHALTAAAAGAAVVVHADVDGAQHDALEAAGAAVVPLDAADAQLVRQVAGARRRRRGSAAPAQTPRRPRLSAGERRALALYVQGSTTVQVASTMGVGYETAKTFLRRARAKYAAVDRPASKRAELVRRAEEDGIL